jgi:very-short-patch-repair endonuclease
MERDVESRVRHAAIDGIVVAADLLGEVSRAGLHHQVEEGRLEDVGRGVWKLRDHPWDWRCQLRAALALAGPGALLGLRTAARLYGWYRYRDFNGIEVVVPRGRDQRTSIGRLVQTRRLPRSHVTVVDGFSCTTPARTFFDLCGDPDPGFRRRGGHPIHARNMERVYNDIVARRGVTFAHEAAVLLVMARRGRRGTVLVRKLLLKLGPKYEPTRSEAESLFVEILETYEVPTPKRQVPISGPDGFIGTVDFLWPDARHIVEVDSRWHDGPLDEATDEERDRRLQAAGYSVARYRYGRMVADPAGIARELGVAIAP